MAEETVSADDAALSVTDTVVDYIGALASPEKYPRAVYYSRPKPTREGFPTQEAYEEARLDYTADAMHMQGKGDYRASECVNERINLVAVLCHRAQVRNVDEETGEVTYNPVDRLVLQDDEGKTYEAVSGGLIQSLLLLFQLMGQPHTWTKPIPVKITQVSVRDKWHTFKLEIWRDKGKAVK